MTLKEIFTRGDYITDKEIEELKLTDEQVKATGLKMRKTDFGNDEVNKEVETLRQLLKERNDENKEWRKKFDKQTKEFEDFKKEFEATKQSKAEIVNKDMTNEEKIAKLTEELNKKTEIVNEYENYKTQTSKQIKGFESLQSIYKQELLESFPEQRRDSLKDKSVEFLRELKVSLKAEPEQARSEDIDKPDSGANTVSSKTPFNVRLIK